MCINQARACTEEKGKNKYLIFYNSVDENKELLKKYTDLCYEIKNKIITVNNDRKHYTKIKFNSYNELLPLNMPIQFYEMTIVIGFVNKGSELCAQFYLVETQ